MFYSWYVGVVLRVPVLLWTPAESLHLSCYPVLFNMYRKATAKAVVLWSVPELVDTTYPEYAYPVLCWSMLWALHRSQTLIPRS